MKWKTTTMVLVGALAAALALGGIGFAYAAETDTTQGDGGLGGALHRAGGGLVAIVADLTGLDVADIIDRQVEGESLADIASAAGVDADDVKAQALEEFESTLDERLASTDGPMMGGRGGRHGGPGGREMMGAAPEMALAEMSDELTFSDIRDRRADGESLSSIASDVGVDIATVIDAVIADASDRLAEAVEAGDLTEDEKTERLDDLKDRLEEMVASTETGPLGGERGMRGGPGF